ncbi:universal stress protein [Microbacterium lushaniae]|nr:universal stress protein [Microbacterium lushaniae]KAA9153375.1 universal stress protein [Microbacterium lushaniae]
MDAAESGQRIIVGVDGSESSVDALRHAARLAAALAVPLEAVVVWSYPPLATPGAMQTWSPEQEAHATLDATITSAFGADPPAALGRRVMAGPTAPTLIRESAGAGMLVLGSRGHGGFVGLLLGSVSTACAQYASCPVLIVHSPQQAA